MKNRLFAAFFLLLLLGAAFSAFRLYRNIQNIELLAAERENLIIVHANELRRMRNTQGQQRTSAPIAQLSPATLRAINAEHLHAIEQAFEVKIKRIETLTKLSIRTQGKAKMAARDTSVLRVAANADTLQRTQAKVYRYRDEYFEMEAIATQNPDSLWVTKYLVRNEITAITFRDKRKSWWKFWKARPLRCQVFLFNPHSGTDTLQAQIVAH
jgi:hypothetical protein